ncbi:hypothetical protein [Paenibacillus sp. BC26]|uniref:hypothetical protein n=1 Tax=Paenibacillus sp. BC26 TaxID=1881032 RepID=UPI0008E06226|nr:hypothetical protein [Paenibacillus sp. BC26]SFS76823.1 hypothetical protein SAMN05428962_2744 [Paenibacillus sp. BC26]
MLKIQKVIGLFIWLLMVTTISGIISSCTVSATSESPVRSEKMLSVKYEDVISLQVVGSLHGIKGSPIYQTSDVTGKFMITKVIDWINSSTPVGIQPDYGRHGYPMVLKIKMSDGNIISVVPAYKCESNKLENGNLLKACSNVNDEIVLYNNSGQIRAKSPDLYKWLTGDWKKE